MPESFAAVRFITFGGLRELSKAVYPFGEQPVPFRFVCIADSRQETQKLGVDIELPLGAVESRVVVFGIAPYPAQDIQIADGLCIDFRAIESAACCRKGVKKSAT